MLSEDSVKKFKSNLRGSVIEPGDKGYDDARKVYNGMIHKKPRLIVRCADDRVHFLECHAQRVVIVGVRSGRVAGRVRLHPLDAVFH